MFAVEGDTEFVLIAQECPVFTRSAGAKGKSGQMQNVCPPVFFWSSTPQKPSVRFPPSFAGLRPVPSYRKYQSRFVKNLATIFKTFQFQKLLKIFPQVPVRGEANFHSSGFELHNMTHGIFSLSAPCMRQFTMDAFQKQAQNTQE